MNNNKNDSRNLLKKVVKYFFLFIVVLASAHTIPIQQLDISESFMIGVSAACTFAILDLYSPVVCYKN
jgi:hypothetical protein